MARLARTAAAAVAAVAAVLATTAGCGLRADERPQPIPRERLSDELFGEAQGTAPGGQTATIFVLSSQGGETWLQELTVPVTGGSGQSRERTALEALLSWTPTATTGPNARFTSRIPSGTVLRDVRRTGDVLVVDLADFSIAGAGQAQAAAQIVYTATEIPGINAVLFTIDGKPVAVPLGERSSAPGVPLAPGDFAALDLVPPTTTTTAPNTSTTTTTPSAAGAAGPTTAAVRGAASARLRSGSLRSATAVTIDRG